MRRSNAAQGPDRPSHFNQEQNVRVSSNETELDYPVGDDAVIEQGIPHGWTPAVDSTPVYLTEAPPVGRPIIRGSAMHLAMDTADRRYPVVSANRNRRHMKVVNSHDTASVALIFGELDNIDVAGFWLGPGDDVEMNHNSAVWAVLADGAAATIEVYTEYEVDDL